MVVQEHRAESVAAGPCSDCGMFVERRTEVIEHFTHSAVQLCTACWHAYRERQGLASPSNLHVGALQ
jgi:hypothetical protein